MRVTPTGRASATRETTFLVDLPDATIMTAVTLWPFSLHAGGAAGDVRRQPEGGHLGLGPTLGPMAYHRLPCR